MDELVPEWLPLPDAAERLGTDVGRVRRMLQEQRLVAVRRGERRILSVPAAFLVQVEEGWQVVPSLQGTLVLLADAGMSDDEAVRWLFTPDPSLESLGTGPVRPRTPVEALALGHKTEIRRRAQAEAL
nr:Rv2175c family DNA-binding protein [Cellulomonas sp. APG4]